VEFIVGDDETYWMLDDGTKLTINDVNDYLDNHNIDVIDIPVVDIVDVIDIPVVDIENLCIATDVNRSENSDLSYPIIITTNGGEYGMLLDGHHRLLKAINNGIINIKARVLELNDAPIEYKKLFKR
jgi:hypothetical protein